MKTPLRALILHGLGINCETEMSAAYRLLGISTRMLHIDELLNCEVSLCDYDILNLPGGFSFGDDLGAGRALANRLRFYKRANGTFIFDELLQFIEAKGFILGICNGFQVLVQLGLLPGLDPNYKAQVALAPNDCGHFIDRWTYVKSNSSHNHIFSDPRPWAFPIRHAEGKLIVADEQIAQQIENQQLVAWSYCDVRAQIDEASNPNGSYQNWAGLIDPTGQVMGLMPHPEAYLSAYNHPNWQQQKRLGQLQNDYGQGLVFFECIANYVAKKKGIIRERHIDQTSAVDLR